MGSDRTSTMEIILMIWFQVFVTYALFVVLPYIAVGCCTVESHPDLNEKMLRFLPFVVIPPLGAAAFSLAFLVWSL